MKIDFYLRFHTKFGQTLAITGDIAQLGNDDPERAYPLSFLNDEMWHTSIEVDHTETSSFHYRYVFTNEDGEHKIEGEKGRLIEVKKSDSDLVLIDSWNDESFYENAFYTAPFKEVYFKDSRKLKIKKKDDFTHQFRIKAPLLNQDEVLIISGNIDKLNNWSTKDPLVLTKKDDWYTINMQLSSPDFPIFYKYGVYNTKAEEFVSFEDGNNRVLHFDGSKHKRTIIHDGFVRLPNTTWKGAGVAIPVFSLRSNNSFGVGEFTDIKLLVDWATETGLKLIQLLPINDTTATYTWVDSYPYAAISAFALHPIYINLQKVAGKKNSQIIRPLIKKQKQLNQLSEVDYEQVMQFKMSIIKELFELDNMAFLEEKDYQVFFEDNKNWLVAYAAFCFLRDKYKTSDFSKWKTNSVYNQDEITKLTSPKSKQFKQFAFYYFIQYHLHLQLKEAADYAHKKGIAMKGDIPIGIYRYGCDAWMAPELYNMDMQAGAPPDDFTIKGHRPRRP